MNASELLKAARKRIEAEDKWTQFAWAVNEEGHALGYDELQQGACKFCAQGAMRYETDDAASRENASSFLVKAIRELHPDFQLSDACGDAEAIVVCEDAEAIVIAFNDSDWGQHENVLAVFDRAIELATKTGIAE
jgi:hypothetical protein